MLVFPGPMMSGISLTEVKQLTLPQLHAVAGFLSSRGDSEEISTGQEMLSHEQWVDYWEKNRGN